MRLRMSLTSLFVIGMALVASPSFGEDLLLPLTAEEEEEARSMNDYFIQKYGFRAKQYRLVKVNTDLLQNAEKISLDLFSGERYDVNTTKVDISTVTGSISWSGMIADQPEMQPRAELVKQLGSEELVDAKLKAIFGVQIQATLYEIDEPSGANVEVSRSIDPREFLSPPEERANRFEAAKKDEKKFYGVEAIFKTIKSFSPVILTPLGMGGPYHILYEVDETKMMDRRLPNGHPENLRRNREYNAFMEDLGDDPRKELHDEKIRGMGIVK